MSSTSKAVPCASTVTKEVTELARCACDEFLTQLSEALSAGGALTSDGLKNKITGKKFYNLCILYFKAEAKEGLAAPSLKLVSRILMLEEHIAYKEDADSVSATLRNGF